MNLSVLETLGLACVGDPNHLVKRLTVLNECGIDRVSLVMGGGDLSAAEVERSLEIIMREVMQPISNASPPLSLLEAAE